jgi:hypothetical protein
MSFRMGGGETLLERFEGLEFRASIGASLTRWL